jgi:archaellum component FlaC
MIPPKDFVKMVEDHIRNMQEQMDALEKRMRENQIAFEARSKNISDINRQSRQELETLESKITELERFYTLMDHTRNIQATSLKRDRSNDDNIESDAIRQRFM